MCQILLCDTIILHRTKFSSEVFTQNRILSLRKLKESIYKFTFYQLIFLSFCNLYATAKILHLSDPHESRWLFKYVLVQMHPSPCESLNYVPVLFFQCRSIQMHPIPFYSWRWSAGHKLMTPTSSSENRGEK